MANIINRVSSNVPGPWFTTTECVDCGMCPEIAPQIFQRDDDLGYSIVFQQAQIEDPAALEAMNSCPVEAIGNTGLNPTSE